MTSTVQPSPTGSWQPDIRIKGDASPVFAVVGAVLLVLAIVLILRPRGSNAE